MRALGAADRPPPGRAPGPVASFQTACEHKFLCADPGSDGVTWKGQGQRRTVTETSRAALSPRCSLRGSLWHWLRAKLRAASLELPGPLGPLSLADIAWNPGVLWEVHPDLLVVQGDFIRFCFCF